ncbi:MAG: response regulator [Abitibacteriaceae bacterium]|nr:response regulator [Abditibacteriaceae bacterium]MBV9867395.1 response regulator [Abditibacteriaceae bacterium]
MEARKVLVADDSPVVSKILSRTLQGAGYTVINAADGMEAAQAVYCELPDLVVLDIFMPRMNGYQVCRLLKHDPLVAHIPIIINTGSDVRGAEFWSRHTGADAFMFKGSPPAELLITVAQLIPAKPVAPTSSTIHAPAPEEILCKLSTLMDQELYASIAKQIELKTILENLCEGIITLDTEQQITSANHFFCQMIGKAEYELNGQSVGVALGEPAGAEISEMFAQALAGQLPPSRDSEIRSQSGGLTPVAINVELVHDYLGETIGGVCLLQDITRRKQIEALNQVKNDLTHMIVHDLRTPLTSLLTGLQTVEALGDLNVDQEEFLNISIEGGEILLGMINDLLDISKMEDGSLRLEYQAVTVSDLVLRAERQVNSLAEAKQLKLLTEIMPDLPVFSGDEDKLLRTLVNLLSNAVKFTPETGSITIAVRLADNRDEVVFTVHDTGEGIPAEAFERIFEKFGQVETRQAGRKMSTGLGLTFCKMVVEAHQGRIWVESELGRGSTFSFTIPLR